MNANDGGMLYRCPSCGATYVAHDQSFDGWRCDHGPTFPRPAHRWGAVYLNAAYNPAFRASAETDPVLERIGTLAEYLGVGTDRLLRVEDWTLPGPVVTTLRWEPPPRIRVAELERRCCHRGFTTPEEVSALLRLARAAQAVSENINPDVGCKKPCPDCEFHRALAAFDFGPTNNGA